MFDSISAIWALMNQRVKDPKAKKLFWVLVLAFFAGWVCTAFAAWISYPSYLGLIDFLPDPGWKAMVMTSAVAGFLYFALAYVAGFLVEVMYPVPMQDRNYTPLAFRILGIAAALFLWVDYEMNMRGAEQRADSAAGTVATYTYETPQETRTRLGEAITSLKRIESGEVGGYGWRDPKTGVFHLNQSGKRAAQDIRNQMRRIEQADSTAQAVMVADQVAFNSRRAEREEKIHQTLRGAVYGVYVFIFLLSLVSAYCVEEVQLAMKGYVKPASQKGGMLGGLFRSSSPTPAPATAQSQSPNPIGFKPGSSPTPTSEPSAPAQNDAHGNRSGHSHTVTVQDGYEITCQQCGTVAVMKSPRAQYCSPRCRKDAWNESHAPREITA